MQELLREYFDGRLSRRGFFGRLVATGLTASAARSVLEASDMGVMPAQQAGAAAPAGSSRMFAGTGGELLMEQVRAAGTRYMFSNPGSVEVALFDALTDRSEIELVVGLHEGIVISMADGYHKLSRQPAFVNVHAANGTAQTAGQMYNANFDGSGLIVTAGLSDNTIGTDEAVLAPPPGVNQSEELKPFTKLSWDVRTGASTALAIRRAYKLAATFPGGPVYVSFSSRGLQEAVKAEVWPKDAFMIQARPRAAASQIQTLARMLIDAKRPLMMLGDELWKADAASETLALCAMLAIPMVAPGMPAFQYVSQANPLYIGQRYGGDRPYPFAGADLIVQFGNRDPGAAPAADAAARFAAVGLDTNAIGRVRPMDLALVGDPKETAKDLADAVNSMLTKDRLAKLRDERLAIVKPAVAAANADRLTRARTTFEQTPIHPDRLGYEMEAALEKNAIIITENQPGVQGKHDFLSFGPRPEDKLNVSHGGGGLGWGVGAAVGAKLGAPDRQVVLSIGDGSVMYAAGGFWSMARHSTAVLTIVWNNYNYQTVRNGAYRYNKRMVETGHYHGLYLGDPDIDFVKLAESQGVKGQKVTSPSDIATALKKGTAETRAGNPYLIEFVVARIGGGADSTWYQKVRPGARGAAPSAV
jgi:thiamine pyrophosphate-dependent acetolactate synthase large subunit-like protein